MATLLDLVAAGSLFKLDPALEANEQEWRTVYALARLRPRFENDLPTWVSTWRVEVTPAQQIDALLEVFCSGETLTFGPQFKPLVHLKDGVWELKTPDIRLFGWFPIKDCFIGGALDLAFNVKNHNLYRGYAGEVAHYRGQLDLDDPKFVPGDNPNAVVSNYTYP
jgi:hypothetical protein